MVSRLLISKNIILESEIKNVLEKMQIEFDRDISHRYQASKLTDVGSLVYKTVVSNKDNQSLFISK